MLKTNEPKTPKFYTLPKIHKENSPGRSFISSINCHTAKLSKFVDLHLQEYVVKTALYVLGPPLFCNFKNFLPVDPNHGGVSLDSILFGPLTFKNDSPALNFETNNIYHTTKQKTKLTSFSSMTSSCFGRERLQNSKFLRKV